MNEGVISEQFGSFKQVKDIFDQNVAGEHAEFGGHTPESDVARHVRGSKQATEEVGFLPTLLGTQGHELNTLLNVGQRMARGEEFNETGFEGQPLTAGRYVAESAQDSVNNLIGQLQAVAELLSVGGLAPKEGVSIDYPGTKMHGAGQAIESGVNKVAEWLRPGGLGGK
jgi:hypothetical protein